MTQPLKARALIRLALSSLPPAAAELVPDVAPQYFWVPALPVGVLQMRHELEDGREQFHGVEITREYLERAHATYQKFLLDLTEKGCQGGEGKRPVVKNHDFCATEDFGWIEDTAVASDEGVDTLWLKVALTKPVPTRRVSIDVEPYHFDEFTGVEYQTFIHHLALTAYPKIKTAEIPTDPAVWEAAGLKLSEAPKMSTKKKTQAAASAAVPATQETGVTASETSETLDTLVTPEAPVVPAPSGSGSDGDEGEVPPLQRQLERALALCEQQARRIEELEALTKPAPAPADELLEQRLAAMEARFSKIASLPTQESGAAVSSPKVNALDSKTALQMAERQLAGKPHLPRHIPMLARKLKGEELDALALSELASLGV